MAGRPQINDLDFDKIYHSNSYGDFKIIENCGRDERSRLYVKIKFLETGSEKIVRYDIAMAGRVRDEMSDIDFDKIYMSNYYGPFKSIAYLGRPDPKDKSKKVVRIRFLNTGYEYNVKLKVALSGMVKDKTISYHDRQISYEPFTQEYDNVISTILYGRWKGMMSRCYNPNDHNYPAYGEIGVSVDPYWHDFDNYIFSLPILPGYMNFYLEPEKYHLDKDYIQMNIPKEKRIYSPKTCMFLSMYDNDNVAILEKSIMEENPFFGVRTKPDGYEVVFAINGVRYNFGKYSDYIVALNEYNYFYMKYSKSEEIKLLNLNIPYVSHEEAQKYLISKSEVNIE